MWKIMNKYVLQNINYTMSVRKIWYSLTYSNFNLPILNLLSNALESNWKLSLKKLFCRSTTGRGTSVRHICGGGICGCGGDGGNGRRILSKLWICWTLDSGRKPLVLSIFTTNVPPYTEIENKWKINGIEASAGINHIL